MASRPVHSIPAKTGVRTTERKRSNRGPVNRPHPNAAHTPEFDYRLMGRLWHVELRHGQSVFSAVDC